MFDTSSVFHSSCSTLNISKQDTAYEDNSSLVNKKTLFCNRKVHFEKDNESFQSSKDDMIHQTSHLNEVFEKGLSKISNKKRMSNYYVANFL